MDWTNEADELLRILWEAGGSLTSIAVDMGKAGYVVSRSAVGGRRWRLGYGTFERPAPKPKSSPRPRSKPKMNFMMTIADEPKEEVAIEPVDGVNYLDQRDGYHCKAILDRIGTDGLHMVCGHRVARDQYDVAMVYCPKHYRAFHNSPGVRK